MGENRPLIPTLDVDVIAGAVSLPGLLAVPPGATHAVAFAHGSGSSRFSPRNRAVAEGFHADGLGTLLFDLLTADEAEDRRNVFDVDLLAARLGAAVAFVRGREELAGLPLSLFGASTGAGAAIAAAAEADPEVSSVVSRGGRPDLAGLALERLRTPTLLIVGERDPDVLRLNRAAMERMTGAETRLEVVDGATHLFEEPGALERVAVLASRWIRAHA
jgi:putative phosphoribosyl transferase